MKLETFVLVVGGGPVGLSAALELQWRGVPVILISANLETAKHPKCNTTNARSMEHFRRLGVADALRALALPKTIERASSYVTRFCGDEFGRMPRSYVDWPTPEIPANVSQINFEREFRRIAEERLGANVHYGWRLDGFEARDGGICARVTDVTTAETHEIRARHMIGADGAGSLVRRTIGSELEGDDGSVNRAFMGGTMLSYYVRCPGLLAASGRNPTHMTWVINPDMRVMMYAQDGTERWVVHYQVPAERKPEDVDPHAVIRAALGCDAPFEILSGGPWTGGLALVADRYQQGTVYLAGDAVHLFTPLGGFGMNTGIGDIMNLCWKLAADHAGWAGPKLIGTYHDERRPIGLRNTRLGVHCARFMDGWRIPSDFESDTDAMRHWRRDFGERIMREDRIQYQTIGLQLGEFYTSPIIAGDGSPPPPDPWDVYTPGDRPGARTPHFWLAPGKALVEGLGNGFTLLCFGGDAGTEAWRRAATDRKIPLEVLGLPMEKPAGYSARFVLVRPDQHIAWSGDTADDPGALLDRARGR